MTIRVRVSELPPFGGPVRRSETGSRSACWRAAQSDAQL